MFINSIKAIEKPKTSPLPLNMIKDFLRINYDNQDEDEILNILALSAINQFEKHTGKAIIKQEWEINYHNINQPYIKLPISPINHINSIKTKEIGHEWNILQNSDYEIEENIIRTKYISYHQFLKVNLNAGITDGNDKKEIPSDIKSFLLKHIAYLYQDRGDLYNTKESNAFSPHMYNIFRNINLS